MQTNLLEQKNKNIRKTWLMMAIVTFVVLVLGYVLSTRFQNPMIFNGFILFSIVQNVVSFWFADKIALASSGAKSITREESPMLYRVADKIAAQKNMPTPPLYIIHDDAPNAFATGRNEKHAAIAVTSGLLSILTEDELEGVFAHEFGHIENRDILVGTVAGIMIGFIIMILHMFARSGGRGNSDRGNSISFVFIILVSILAPIFGQLIQLAISRKREFLADATGALTTGHPENLASALQKISNHAQPMQRINQETSHLFIANPYGGIKTLFMSHPPVEERIKALLGSNQS
jgi:heat shock protein HtpX